MEKYTNHWITDEIHILIDGVEHRGVLFFEKGTRVKQYSIRLKDGFELGNHTHITIYQNRSRINKLSVLECINYLFFNRYPEKGFDPPYSFICDFSVVPTRESETHGIVMCVSYQNSHIKMSLQSNSLVISDVSSREYLSETDFENYRRMAIINLFMYLIPFSVLIPFMLSGEWIITLIFSLLPIVFFTISFFHYRKIIKICKSILSGGTSHK